MCIHDTKNSIFMGKLRSFDNQIKNEALRK